MAWHHITSYDITSHNITWHLATNHIACPHVTSKPATWHLTTSRQSTKLDELALLLQVWGSCVFGHYSSWGPPCAPVAGGHTKSGAHCSKIRQHRSPLEKLPFILCQPSSSNFADQHHLQKQLNAFLLERHNSPDVPGSKVPMLGMVISPLIGILIMGPYKPLRNRVDDHPLMEIMGVDWPDRTDHPIFPCATWKGWGCL